MSVYIAGFCISLIFLFITLFEFKKRKIDFRYCIFFSILSIILMCATLFKDWIEYLAELLGIVYAPAILFVFILIFLLYIVVYLASFITQITKKITRLTQEVAILRGKIDKENKK